MGTDKKRYKVQQVSPRQSAKSLIAYLRLVDAGFDVLVEWEPLKEQAAGFTRGEAVALVLALRAGTKLHPVMGLPEHEYWTVEE